MSLSSTSIKNPVFAWMIMIGVSVFGWIAFQRLGVSQLPDVDFPVLSISASWEGAAPEVIETEIVDPIEDAIMGVEGVEEVMSTSRQGEADITVQFNLSKDIDVALQEVQSRIARAQRSLPADMDPAIITKSNPEDQPILWLSLSGDFPSRYLMEYTKNFLKGQLSTVPGVGEVSLGGFVEPNLRVWLDAKKMEQQELTVDDVTAAIDSQHAEMPAGYIDTGSRELNVRVLGEAGTEKEFSNLVIPARKGSPLWKKITIGEVATIEDGLANVRQIARSEGKTTVGIGIRKQRGTNAVEVARAVKLKTEQLQKYLPKGMQLGVRFDSTTFVEDSIRDMNLVMVLSVILTALVCWLFLGSFSSALNVFLTIPLSLFGALFVIYLAGFTLNTFTLLGLSLVIGIVVDDAIMVLENIARHRELGEGRILAAVAGSREITFAALAATVAILAIFIPVVFMQGIIGKYFFQFGVTISAAVMISLIGALTITPMMCSQFLKIGHSSAVGGLMDRLMERVKNVYARLLKWCLAHRVAVIAGACLFFGVSMFLFKSVKKEFVPPQDQSRLSVKLETRTGSSLEYTDAVIKEAEKILTARPEVETAFVTIGGHMVNSGSVNLTLKPPKDRPADPRTGRRLTQQQLIPVLRKELRKLPGVTKVVVQDLSLMGFTARRGMPVEFTLSGPDWERLGSLSGELGAAMEKTGLMVDIDSDYEAGIPEVRVLPDRQKAAERGVSVSVIANTINATIGGLRSGKYTRDGRRYDVRVQLVAADRSKVQDIGKVWVRNNRGEVVRLSDVVTVIEKPALVSITRKNRERAIRMFANIAPGKSQGEALAAVEKLAGSLLPDGYRIVFSGSAQTFKDSFTSLYVALILGIFVAYMVLGTQFNSFVHPFTVLLALPFSVSGAFIALLLSGQSLNIYSAIGIILLMGIVKKNSILLVDFTNQRRDEGMDVHKALMSACPVRLRPIIMTSMATIAAAIPSALSFGPGAETRMPMAMVVIGGVSVSTLLTLFVVPCAYSLLSGLESAHHRLEARKVLRELAEQGNVPGPAVIAEDGQTLQ